MLKLLKSYIKKLFSDLHSVIIGIIVVLIIGTPLVLKTFFQDLWLELLKYMQLQTPLWLTILIVLLLVLYIYIKTRNTQSSTTPKNENICPKCKQETFEIINSNIRSRTYKCTECGYTDKTLKDSYQKMK